jgi:hypothetical protein
MFTCRWSWDICTRLLPVINMWHHGTELAFGRPANTAMLNPNVSSKYTPIYLAISSQIKCLTHDGTILVLKLHKRDSLKLFTAVLY